MPPAALPSESSAAAQAEPANVDAVKVDAVNVEPANVEPANVEPAEADAVKVEPPGEAQADAGAAAGEAADALPASDASASSAPVNDAPASHAPVGDAPAVDSPAVPGDAVEAPADASLVTQLICDGAMESPEVVAVARGSVCYYSRRCEGKPTANEDAAAVIPVADRGVVIAVADGVGGLPQGDKAARITLETLAEHVGRITDPAALRSTILDAIERANRRVLAIGGGAATTLAVAQIVDGRARTYHVGDSEVLIVNGRGAIKSQTIAHAPVAYGVHSGWIDAVDALVHEQRNLVSNVIGSTEMRIEIGPPIRLAQRDIVLVCSDGITDNLHAEEIGAEVCGRTAEGAVHAVLESLDRRRELDAGELYKDDDATLVTYRRTVSTSKGPTSKRPSSKGIPLSTAPVELPAQQVS